MTEYPSFFWLTTLGLQNVRTCYLPISNANNVKGVEWVPCCRNSEKKSSSAVRSVYKSKSTILLGSLSSDDV